MIHKVSLSGFGPHEKLECDFQDRLNLIVGKNGAGKSNMVYAIGWVLLGPRAIPSEFKQSDIINDNYDQVKGVVDIDINGKLHRFRRTYDGKQVSASISIVDEDTNESRIAETPTGVSYYLESVGFDLQAFSVLVSMQDDLTKIIKETPANRVKLFDKLLDTEIINSSIDQCRVYGNREIPRPEILDEDINLHNRDLEVCKKNIAHYEDKKSELVEKRNKADKHFKLLKAELSNLDNYSEKYDEIGKEIVQCNKQINKIDIQLNQLNSFFSFKPTKSEEELIEDKDEINKKLRTAESLADLIVRDYQQKEKEMDRLHGEVAALYKVRDTIVDSGICLACGTEDVETGHIITRLELKRVNLLKITTEYENLEKLMKKRLVETDEIKLELNKILDQLDYYREASEHEKLIASLKPEKLKAEAKISELQKEARKLKLKLPDSDFMEKFNKLDAKLISLNYAIEQVEKEISNHTKRKDELKRKVKQYRSELKDYNDKINIQKDWKAATKELKKFKSFLIMESLIWVSTRATQILQKIDSLPDIGPDSKIVIDDKLEFWIESSKGKTPIRRYSGGQKSAFSVCLRIALAEFFSSQLGLNGMLILDAAFESMDNYNREATALALESAGDYQSLIFMYEDVPSITANRIWLGD